jgi:hypothetical protein
MQDFSEKKRVPMLQDFEETNSEIKTFRKKNS